MSTNVAFASCLSVKESTCPNSHQALVYPVYKQDGSIDLKHLGGINLYGESEWYDLETSIEFEPTHVSNELKDYFLRCYYHLEHLNWFSPYQLAKTIQIIDSQELLISDLKEAFTESCRRFQIFPVHTGKPLTTSFVWNDYVITPSFQSPNTLKEPLNITLQFRYTCPIEQTVKPNQYDFLVLEQTKDDYKVKKMICETKQYQSILNYYQKKIITFNSINGLPFVKINKSKTQLIATENYPLLFEHLIEIELSLNRINKQHLLKQLCLFWEQYLF